ncbi:MAG: tetratricopeptide repeat protein [Candidatus Zixiibacteriota bacterium]
MKNAPELRKRFSIVGTPTVLVCKPGGEEIDRTMGFRRTGEFIPTIENYEKGIGTLAALLAEEKSKSGDPQFLYRLAGSLQAHFRLDEADARFAAIVASDPENKSGRADSAVLDIAWDLRKREDWTGAAAKCRELVQRWPTSDLADDASVSAGWYAGQGGMKDDAIAAYREYLEKWPKGEDSTFAREQIVELQKPPEADSEQ